MNDLYGDDLDGELYVDNVTNEDAEDLEEVETEG